MVSSQGGCTNPAAASQTAIHPDLGLPVLGDSEVAVAEVYAAAAAARASLQKLHTLSSMTSVEALFLQHKHYLDAACMERVVIRVLRLSQIRATEDSSAICPGVTACPERQPAAAATILSNILSHQPQLSIKAATALLSFFLSHPTMHIPRDHLLSVLCQLPDSHHQQLDFTHSGNLLCVLGGLLPGITPGKGPARSKPGRKSQTSASATPNLPPKLHQACTEFTSTLVRHIIRLMNRSDSLSPSAPFTGPESLAMICAGATRLQVDFPPFWDAAASALLRGGMTSGGLEASGIIATAFASSGQDSPYLAKVFSHIAELMVGKAAIIGQPQASCAALLVAFGKVGFHHAPLFDEVLSATIAADLGKLDVLNVSCIVLACARVGHDRRLVDDLLRRLVVSPAWERRAPSEMIKWASSNMLWSLSVMEMLPDHPSLVSQLRQVFKHTTSLKRLHPVAAMQLTQVRALLTRLGMSTRCLPATALLARAVAAGSKQSADFLRFNGSNMQSDVLKRLTQMIGSNGIVSVQHEGKLMDGLLSVDVLVGFESGRRVAVEVDGHHHFLLSDSRKVDGRTRLRNDMLAYAVGGSCNLVCLRREGHCWSNYISGKSSEGSPESFLLEEVLAGGKPRLDSGLVGVA